MKKEKASSKSSRSNPKIVSLETYRKGKNEQRRREYERILFNRVLGVYSFLELKELTAVDIVDISLSGVRLRQDRPGKALKVGEKVALRLYFTPSSFLRLALEVKRELPFIDREREGIEYGCELDKNTKSYAVMKELVNFMQRYADVAVQDTKPPLIWF